MRKFFREFVYGNRNLPAVRPAGPGRRLARRAFPHVEEMDRLILPTGLSGIQAVYAVTNDWGSGFQAAMTLNNTTSTGVSNWKLDFDLAANISTIWNATISSHSGTHYTVVGAAWDSRLTPSGSVDLGFVASPGGGMASPTNIVVSSATGSVGGSTQLPGISISGAQASVNATGTTPLTFTVSLSQASTTPVTVQYATVDGTAKAGTAYTATSGTLSFAAGVKQQTVTVQVKDDTQNLISETLSLVLSHAIGGTLSSSQAIGTIIKPAQTSTGNDQFQVTSNWGSGFSGQITITNPTAAPVNNWSLAFDFPDQISAIWDAGILSHSGNHYVVRNAGWNSTIPAGGTASFGFNASPGGATDAPTNYVLQSGGGDGGGTVQNPTAVADSAWTYQSQSTIINVLANDTDPNQYVLTVSSYTQGQHGVVARGQNGTVIYQPASGFVGTDSFNYTISDGHGGTATASVTVNVIAQANGNWSSRFFAPYVDMTLWPTYNLASAMTTANIKYFTLAFVVADSANGNIPSWGGFSSYDVNGSLFDQQVRAQVATVRSLGGDVMVSFGGENGAELAQSITNVSALENAYQSVINAYQLTHIDFDIEGAAVADHASIDRRSQAMAALQKAAAVAGKPLQIWLTLPALPTGLTADGLYVVQSAIKAGVKISGINAMTMDYGDSAAPNPQGQMGTYAIQAANSLLGQLRTLYGTTYSTTQLWSMIGITPMIGVNDATDEVFDLAAARQLETFATQTGMGRISMWSLNRDQQDPAGKLNYTENHSSSILQSLDEFSKTFLLFEN